MMGHATMTSVYLPALMLVALMATGCRFAAKSVDVSEIAVVRPPLDALQLPWANPDDPSWKECKPLFQVGEEAAGLSGRGWVAVTKDDLLIRLVVVDRHHLPPDRTTPYAGDGVELCIDARGDGTCGLDPNHEGVHGADDAKFMMAITKTGPFITRTEGGGGKPRGELAPGAIEGRHDAERGETVYELRLSWDLFDTRPGLCDTLGIAVQFNDLDPGMSDKNVLKWGEGTYGEFRPGLFNRAWMPQPGGEYAAIAASSAVLWDVDDKVETVVAVASTRKSRLSIRFDDVEHTVDLPSGDELRRYRVTFRPSDSSKPNVPFAMALRQENEEAPFAELDGAVEFPEATYRTLLDELATMIASAKHPLMLRHLASVRSLVRCGWARLDLTRETARQDAEETRQFLATILAGFREGDAGDWDSYASGRRNLVCAYVSPHDRSVQYYLFALPRDWDADKAYPLFFELHGATNPNPLAKLAWHLGPIAESSESGPLTYAAVQGNGYWCEPFGRGNLGYRGIAEVDVWEAYDDVHRRFHIDENRRYLYGFSMGGGGTWSLGTRTPDRWAAMAVLAGGTWREKAGVGMGRNIAHLPVMLWCGERDGGFPNLARMQSELAQFGGKPLVKSTPGLGHNYRMDIQEDVVTWLQTHARRRPDRFHFIADSDEHLGAYGITLARDVTVSALPHFTCTIEGDSVTIDSQGAPGLEVVAGKGGLGLDGQIRITWNGKQAYEGPAGTVTLGDWRPPRRR